ncbi:hypothetical protein PILCRDRAFT_84588 [Piloderma croceum F 1598]|uniref:Uncharacterized protein n=1 Tax=Piloderma croceum (strain F 1598) TaxID=765440 RepID=A0A0C3G0B6_PILCF|nr:hypothetical protein PILCRDRAFT_84588 [Piloderma croceum F 1598]
MLLVNSVNACIRLWWEVDTGERQIRNFRSPKIIAQIDFLHSRIETLVTVYQLEKFDGSNATNHVELEETERSHLQALWVSASPQDWSLGLQIHTGIDILHPEFGSTLQFRNTP